MKSKQERLMEVYNYVRENCNVHTKTEFAAYLHMTQPALSAAINGHEAYLTKNLFIKISSAFPGVFNLNYLLTGQGTLLANTEQIASEPQPQQTQALDMSYAIEKVIGRATAYADKTIEALEGQVRDKEEIITLLRHRVKELEAKLATTARQFPSDTPYGVAEHSER